MELFLTSNIGGYKKINDIKIPTSFDNSNKFLENLKYKIKKYNKFIYIPSDPNDYEKNDKYIDLYVGALNLSGIKFKKYIVLDCRNLGHIKEILEDSSLIILGGGDAYKQNQFFNNIDLSKYLKNIDCCIVGISAGSINCSKVVFNSPETEEDLKKPYILKGLDLTDVNIEPHFNETRSKVQQDAIIAESFNRKIYGLEDGSYILNNKIYGNCFLIFKGKIKRICDNDKTTYIDNN